MSKPPSGTTALAQAGRYGVPNIKRHILLCSGPDCVDPALGQVAWDYLKRRLQELGLNQPPHSVYRTRCHCLRICVSGPIAVVCPDGTWYHSATPPVLERILQEHVIAGRPVQEFILIQNGLSAPPLP